MNRKTILDRPDPPLYLALIDESVLCRPITSPDMMRRQLEHLIEMSDRPNIRIQVVPSGGGIAGLDGGFVIAQLPDEPDAVYLQSATMGYIIDTPGEVAAVYVRYEAIRADALPVRVSIDLIREKLMNLWT